nr:metallophosphoesterase [Lysinibacillus timonensis]
MITFVVVLLIGCFGILLYMVKEAFENNVLTHEVTLQGQDETIKLFFISDIHVRKVNEGMITNLKGKFNAVIIGGDLADKRTPKERIRQNLRLLQQLGPLYFIWGNNDREVGEENLRAILNEYNVRIIENSSMQLPQTNNIIWISGIDDTTTKNVRYDKAFEKCGEHDKVIFISHNPKVFAKVRSRYNVSLLMGGHLHGGQIRLGPFGIYPHGSFFIDKGVPTLISNGYGTTLLPLRFGAKPQCHIIDIKIKGQM